MPKNRYLLILFLIFALGLLIRIYSVYPSNIIIGFDQARDLFEVYRIYQDFDLKIIGPTAGNNPNMHHGILYLYYILLPLAISNGNPMWAVSWNIIVTSLNVFVIYFLSKKLFQCELSALISAFIVAISNQLVQFSGWLSNPSPTVLTVPIFFLGLWMYYQRSNLGLIIAAFFLGLSIQFELFFIYLIPITGIIFLMFKFPMPSFRIFILSFMALFISLGTMILTEFKYNFGTVKALIDAGNKVSGANATILGNITNFIHKFNQSFSQNLFPNIEQLGVIASLVTILFLIQRTFYADKLKRKSYLFILIYLVSPAIMLLLGYHNAPWFLIALPPAIAISFGKLISTIKSIPIVIAIIFTIGLLNLKADITVAELGQTMLEPDKAALLADQIRAIDYTYALGPSFTVNTLTNPLYINAVWAYNYLWYGQNKYKFLPTWSGGDQIYPYDTLNKQNGSEAYLYLIIDQTNRIPMSHKLSLIDWANEQSKLIEEKNFGDILVQRRLRTH